MGKGKRNRQSRKSDPGVAWTAATVTEAQINELIDREFARRFEELQRDYDAVWLWGLHQREGWGKKHLARFYEDQAKDVRGLMNRYESSEAEDIGYICRENLKKIGFEL